MSFPPKHLLDGTELSAQDIDTILNSAKELKKNPLLFSQHLANKNLSLIFEKPSFRTRLSFMRAIQSLGGTVIESTAATRKQETPADMIRVLNAYTDFVMIRTHNDAILQEMATYACIPVINGLSELFHPCQILADLLSLHEVFGDLKGLTLSYIGDGNNILHSLLLMAPLLGVNVHYSCPENHQPNELIQKRVFPNTRSSMIKSFSSPSEAVRGADAVYTDVWASMGCEEKDTTLEFADFQVNEQLMAYAKATAVFMHCMPMERGKEVSMSLPDGPSSIIFRQSENRLHVQKALLLFLNDANKSYI